MALIQAAFGNHLLEELVLSSLRTMVLRTIILVSYTLIVSADTYVSLCTDVRIVRTCIRTYIHTCMRRGDRGWLTSFAPKVRFSKNCIIFANYYSVHTF